MTIEEIKQVFNVNNEVNDIVSNIFFTVISYPDTDFLS